MSDTLENGSRDGEDAMLADDISQLLALGDALDSREPEMISHTISAVIRVRGIDSLALAGGVSRDRLRSAIQLLQPEDCALLRELVAKLLAGLDAQAGGAISGDAAHSPMDGAADNGLRGP